jgi:hypothetical protein
MSIRMRKAFKVNESVWGMVKDSFVNLILKILISFLPFDHYWTYDFRLPLFSKSVRSDRYAQV